MALTKEQFTQLYNKGLSVDQIRAFEAGKKPEDIKREQQSEIQPEKSLLRKTGDLFTASTQKFGTTAGQAFAAEGVTKALSEADQINSQVRLDLTKRIIANRNAGKDTSRLEQALSQLPTSDIQSDVANIVPAINKSTGQVLGEALGTVVEATAGGALSGVEGFGLTKSLAPTAAEEALKRSAFLAKPLGGKLAEIGINTAKNLATTVPFGYVSDVATNLQQGKTGLGVAKPGMGTLITSVIPIGIGSIQAGRQITAEGLSKIVAPNLSGVSSGAYERLKTGKPQEFLGKVTPRSVLDDARASASAFNSTMKREFGTGKEEIIQEFTGKRIGLNEQIGNKLTKIAERFGFEDRLPASLQDLSPKETMDILAEINAIKPVTAIDDPLVRSLKLNLSDIKKELMEKAVKEFGGEGGKFQQIYKNYTQKSNTLKNIQSIIGTVGIKPNSIKLTPVQEKTAIGRLQRVFTENADGYIEAIKALEDETGKNILDKVAASQLSPIAPKALRTPTNLGGILDDVVKLITLPISSPRIGQWLIRKIGGYDTGVATKILNASPSVRTAIYNAVNKENMSFDDAVKLYARDYIQNPKLGASIQRVGQNEDKIAKQLLSLDTSVPTVNGAPALDSMTDNWQRLDELKNKLETKGLTKPEYSEVDTLLRITPGAGELKNATSPILQEAKKYKSAEEFVKAQDKTATGAKVPDILKVYALDDKDLGQIYRQSGLKSSAYPADFTAKNNIPELKIQKGDKISILANDKEAKRFTIENIPERKTESGTYSKSAQVGDLVEGYSRQDQIDFINKNFSKEGLTKSQLTDIFNKAHGIIKGNK